MGVLAEAVRNLATRSGGWLGPYGSGDKALLELFGARPSSAGVSVNEHTALYLSPVWAAVTIISSTIGALPLNLFKNLPNDGKEIFTEHPLYRLLHDRPNPETSAPVFRETLQAHLLLWGNAYAEIQRDPAGRPVALWQLTPDRVQPFREEGRGHRLRYRVDQENGKQSILDTDDMLHIPGLGFDGIQGYSVIQLARESLGLIAATEKFGAGFFGRGATPGLTAHHPGKLSEAAHKRLKDSLTNALQGPDRAHNLILLEEGVTVEKVGIPPDDAQFIESRRFGVLEIARLFNIPPHMLKDLDRATFSNIEEQGREFVTYTLNPWLVKWEKELEWKLIRPLERSQQFIKHNVDALLRGRTFERYQAHVLAIQNGLLSINGARLIEDLNPIGPEGDIYLIPQNMVPADRINEIIDAQIASKTPPPAAPPSQPTPLRAEPDPEERMRALAALIVEQLRPELPPLRFVEVAEIAQTAAAETLKALPPTPSDPALLERLDGTEQRLRETVGATITERLATALAEDREQREQQRAALELGLTEVRDAAEAARAELVNTRESVDSVQAAAAAAQVELRERLDASEVARQAQAARIAGLVPSLRDVIEGAVRKEVRFEAERARKASQSPEKLRAWLGSFYVTREDSSVQFLLPAMRLPFALTGRQEDAETETRRLIGAWVAESQTALTGLLEHPETLEADVKALVARWELERPAAIADELMKGVLAHGL